MSETIKGAKEDIADDLAALRRDIAHLTEAMRGLAEDKTQAAGLRLSEAMGDAKNKISNAADDASKQVWMASGEIEAAVDRNPLTAVLIALGVGIAIGLVSKTRG